MSILASLAKAYERLPEKPPFGFSSEKIAFLISLNEDGTVAHVADLRVGGGKKKEAPAMLVPQAIKRSSGIAPNFLWDKSAYVLGVTAGEAKRTADEHAAFVDRHREALEGNGDAGLAALMRFLGSWSPERFVELGWPDEMKDQNIAFTLEADRLHRTYLHDRPAAKALWKRLSAEAEGQPAVCLVSGETGPIARLHPSIKGVWGAQSSGASIVSFNDDAYESYGHKQGDNAPVSEAAAFAYTTALNRFLEKDSGHRIQIGDASTVFWADGSDAEKTGEAETIFSILLGAETAKEADGAADDSTDTKKVGVVLEKIRAGMPLESADPGLAKDVRFYVLGLAPNAARLSIRFWLEDDFGELVRHYQDYARDIRFEPWPASRPLPTIFNCVSRTAPARRLGNGKITFDKEQVSPLLSGELFRAILTGRRFPAALLSLLLMRVRSDQVLDAVRVSLIKALILRAMRIEDRLPIYSDGTPMEDYLVRSDPDDPNPARRLGRLFAVIERAQRAALGDDVNSTVKDKYLGAAAATPQRVFPGILKNAQNHTKRLRNGHSEASWIKDAAHARNVGIGLERDIGQIAATFNDGFPLQHSNEEQGLFLIGYYQERYGAKADPDADEQTEIQSEPLHDEEGQRL